jgi:hypothetical protein
LRRISSSRSITSTACRTSGRGGKRRGG